jgi:hypothetical protein
LIDYEEMIVRHPTDIKRVKEQATVAAIGSKSGLSNADVLIIANATVLTMEGQSKRGDLIHDGVLITKGGLIDWVGLQERAIIPEGAMVIDAQGGLPAFQAIPMYVTDFFRPQ